MCHGANRKTSMSKVEGCLERCLERRLERCLECRRISNVEGSRRMSRKMSRKMSRMMSRMSKGLESRRVSLDVSLDVSKNLECRRMSNVEGSRRMSRKMSRRISNVEGSRMSLGFVGCLVGWDVVFQAYSPLLVLVCRSVSQDPPPGRLKTLLLRSVFYTLCRQRSANQRSRMPTRHLADQSAIASRRTPPISDQSFALRKSLLN